MSEPLWHHYVYEKWELFMDKTFTKIEKHPHGPFIQVGLSSSARGANCYEDEIDALIEALQAAKTKCKELSGSVEQMTYTKKGKK